MQNKELSILLIEDDEDDFFILDQLIKKNNHLAVNLFWKKSVNEGIESFEKENFDLVFVDYYLGANTALDFLNHTKKNNSTPIVVLTGLNDREKDVEVMNAGASDYLPKEKLNENIIERTIRYNIERKISHDKLKNESKKYKQLFELSIDPFFVLDENFKLLNANNSMLSLLQIEKEKMQNHSLKCFIKNTHDYDFIVNKLKQRKPVKNKELTVKNILNDEADCIFSVTGYTDETTGKTVYQGTIHDISLIKRIQEKTKNQEKIGVTGKMARTIAHEIRNPLTNISLSVNEIKDIIGGGEQEMFIEIIERSSSKINEIVTDFISSTKPPELILKSLSINDIVLKAVENCNDRVKLKNIELQTTLKATNNINADEEKLPLVFINLITNAIEALENNDSPKITISTRNEATGVMVLFTDNGIGMSKETLDNLFSSFFTQKTSGLGIGMSTIYNILASHDAYIKVSSELGHGSTFKIYFD